MQRSQQDTSSMDGLPRRITGMQVRHDRRRRGTVMVFVLGVLALIGLVGLALIAKTHGEFKRVNLQSASTSNQVVMDGAIRIVLDVLYDDIWAASPSDPSVDSSRPLSGALSSESRDFFGNLLNPLDLRENNEPFDHPNVDRWLASSMPHFFCETDGINIVVCSDQVPTVIDPLSPTPTVEDNVLAWQYVSYLGTDISKPLSFTPTAGVTQAVNPFMWAGNSRDFTPAINTLVRYGPSKLTDIKILQTPPPLFSGELIPGSTTNVTIRAARELWNGPGHQAQLGIQLSSDPTLVGLIPQFPYFDTNLDGEVDLYDADGDGCPDSPISFPIELDSPDPNRPRRLYAAIRIVDHAGMLNVNTASAFTLPGGDLTFDEATPGLQRRGRSTTEFLLENVVHRQDWFSTARTANLADYRSNNVIPNPDPVRHDFDVVRRVLLGGLPDFSQRYNLYGLTEEASLRHRNMLVRYDRRADNRAANDYRTIDVALPGTMLWSRNVLFDTDTNAFHYNIPVNRDARWNRLNANYQPTGSVTTYEGYSVGSNAGWRQLLDEDQSLAVKRPMLTTVNVDVAPPPDIASVASPAPAATVDDRLLQLWNLGMNWPVLIPASSPLLTDPNRPQDLVGVCTSCSLVDQLTVPDGRLPPDWARVHPIDINMGSVDDPLDAKGDFLRYMAAAMYLALDGVDRYQIMPLSDSLASNASLNRLYLAWQFAVNLVDYRDSDGVPTILEVPGLPGQYVYGIEKQPFFTEAFAFLKENEVPAPNNNQSDKWYFAFELFVPPGWSVSTDNLYFHAPGADASGGPLWIPLNDFVPVGSAPSIQQTQMLDGGAVNDITPDRHGNYFVFCGSRIHEPTLNDLAQFEARAYTNGSTATPLRIATDGNGRLELVYSPTGDLVDPRNHVLDVIGPEHSGDVITGADTGRNVWATRGQGINQLAEQNRHFFSLRRSTKGWRFTTGWHTYGQTEVPSPNNAEFGNYDESLGKPNDVLSNLNDNIPESIWPTLTSLTEPGGEPRFVRPDGNGGVDLVNGFESGQPFEAFDSVADLSRLYMLGPRLNQFSLSLFDAAEDPNRVLPVTYLLARTIEETTIPNGLLPQRKIERVAAGRLDFEHKTSEPPWTWRLFDYLTTQGHLFDSVDNDGDGNTDLSDPTEAYDVLFRLAGRVNLNTAPASVLRSGPFMSYLPTSPEQVLADPSILQNPAQTFNNENNPLYWDFPTAIVAARENRSVPLRLPDADGVPQIVALAERGLGQGPSVMQRGAFAQVIELAGLRADRAIIDNLDPFAPRNHLFQVDRFWAENTLRLPYHKFRADEPALGPEFSPGDDGGDFFSPDFRYRRDSETADYVPILSPPDSVGDPLEAGGIRGRDTYLSRWTNIYTTRSDCFTAYIALIDEDGNYVQRSQVTLDRSVCFQEAPAGPGGFRVKILPRILARSDGSYLDDTK
ncbi:MAG: hypothetical protein MI923_05255 [Phycisphaerales bacterium]|nr:hypothetical protein [Phycisphaerales bacterium]